jgi:hypothetical protein
MGFIFMIKKVVTRNGEKVTEVRSEAGKLLLVKTKKGYELKCPLTKKVCLIKYEEMLSDCLECCDKELLEELKIRS